MRGLSLDGVQVGDVVRLHPVSQAWNQGFREGTVIRLGHKYLHVDVERSGESARLRICTDDVLEVVEQ